MADLGALVFGYFGEVECNNRRLMRLRTSNVELAATLLLLFGQTLVSPLGNGRVVLESDGPSNPVNCTNLLRSSR
jgi:hypothetical protein